MGEDGGRFACTTVLFFLSLLFCVCVFSLDVFVWKGRLLSLSTCQPLVLFSVWPDATFVLRPSHII